LFAYTAGIIFQLYRDSSSFGKRIS